MKRLLTLLLAVASFSATYAQSSTTQKAKRIIRGDRPDYDPDRPSSGDAKDIIIGRDGRPVYDDRGYYPTGSSSRTGQINREYDAKIRSIRNNPTLSRAEKDWIIRRLEAERARRIREADRDYRREDRRYSERSREYRDYDDDYGGKKYKYKGNNGKHLGWQKGKGNPHRRG